MDSPETIVWFTTCGFGRLLDAVVLDRISSGRGGCGRWTDRNGRLRL
ncbi:hypothetical protein OROGR_009343 [Orobanche gracilis]